MGLITAAEAGLTGASTATAPPTARSGARIAQRSRGGWSMRDGSLVDDGRFCLALFFRHGGHSTLSRRGHRPVAAYTPNDFPMISFMISVVPP